MALPFALVADSRWALRLAFALVAAIAGAVGLAVAMASSAMAGPAEVRLVPAGGPLDGRATLEGRDFAPKRKVSIRSRTRKGPIKVKADRSGGFERSFRVGGRRVNSAPPKVRLRVRQGRRQLLAKYAVGQDSGREELVNSKGAGVRYPAEVAVSETLVVLVSGGESNKRGALNLRGVERVRYKTNRRGRAKVRIELPAELEPGDYGAIVSGTGSRLAFTIAVTGGPVLAPDGSPEPPSRPNPDPPTNPSPDPSPPPPSDRPPPSDPPPPPPPPEPGPPVTVAAVGDIACDPNDPEFNGGLGTSGRKCRQAAVAATVAGADPNVLLALGDIQYETATLDEFYASYDLDWSQFNPIVRPVAGNHEYDGGGAKGYYDYFNGVDEDFGPASPDGDRTKGYYSFDMGNWHFVALNSNCDEIDCDETSEQYAFLANDLATSSASCTLVYWHHPLFSSGKEGGAVEMLPMMRLMDDFRVDLALTGHNHIYERFAPQTADGVASSSGVRHFISGMGGKSPHSIRDVREANSELVDNSSPGALILELDAGSYSWSFEAAKGFTLEDEGAAQCV